MEIKAVQRIQSVVTQRLGLRRPVTVHALTSRMSGEALDALQEAEESGLIREGGDSEVLEADVIFRAVRREDRSPVWLAVEVSNTIDQSDILRAQDRAGLLAAAYSTDSVGVVAGIAIRPEDESRAASMGVAVVLL